MEYKFRVSSFSGVGQRASPVRRHFRNKCFRGPPTRVSGTFKGYVVDMRQSEAFSYRSFVFTIGNRSRTSLRSEAPVIMGGYFVFHIVCIYFKSDHGSHAASVE